MQAATHVDVMMPLMVSRSKFSLLPGPEPPNTVLPAHAGLYCLCYVQGSKAALGSMTESLAMECNPFGVSVTSVVCGHVRSDIINNSMTESERWNLTNQTPSWLDHHHVVHHQKYEVLQQLSSPVPRLGSLLYEEHRTPISSSPPTTICFPFGKLEMAIWIPSQEGIVT